MQIAEILQQKSLISKTTVDLNTKLCGGLKENCVKFGFAVLDVCCKISATPPPPPPPPTFMAQFQMGKASLLSWFGLGRIAKVTVITTVIITLRPLVQNVLCMCRTHISCTYVGISEI